MRILAFMNQKGGVGKTTTAVNVGAALAELGKKVCLIDLDPQAHLTINYGLEPSSELVSLYQVLVDERPLLDALHKVEKNISVVPSSIDLAAAEIELVAVPGRESILKKRFEAAEADFDYVLMDCPPSLGLLTINALALATEVIIPMQPHFLALQGVGKLLETVALVCRRMNPALKVSGLVLTMFDSQTKLSTEVVEDIKGFIAAAADKPLPWAGARIFNTRIRRNIKLAESPSFAQHILKYEPTSNGAADYRALAREILYMNEPPPKAMAGVDQPGQALRPGAIVAGKVPNVPVALAPPAPVLVRPVVTATPLPASVRPVAAPAPALSARLGISKPPPQPFTGVPGYGDKVRPSAAAPKPTVAAPLRSAASAIIVDGIPPVEPLAKAPATLKTPRPGSLPAVPAKSGTTPVTPPARTPSPARPVAVATPLPPVARPPVPSVRPMPPRPARVSAVPVKLAQPSLVTPVAQPLATPAALPSATPAAPAKTEVKIPPTTP